ncbi:MAG TPA: hypothetical protein DE036_09985 [Actinobacteria bacterium]|nr:hypothetical protein [Actinomycetota bacterium]
MSDKTASIITIILIIAVVSLVGYSYLREYDMLPSFAVGGILAANGGQTAPVEKTAPSGAMPACVCHSKKAAMVKMHDALDGEDCGKCHSSEENLMDPERPASSKQALEKRKKNEAICADCHKNGKTVVKKRSKDKTKISNALFCPKCKKQLSRADADCGDCGGKLEAAGDGWSCTACGPLVDIDKVAAMSKEKPSNDICAMCHYDLRSLAVTHQNIGAFNKSVTTVKGGLSNCLACHESHNKCGGCHF